MKRIYVAGAYSANNVMDVLDNIGKGISASVKILKGGEAPFCPWLDHQFHFYDGSLTIEDYYNYSMAWLEVSDEVRVLPGWENSKGTRAEIARAKELGIPVTFL